MIQSSFVFSFVITFIALLVVILLSHRFGIFLDAAHEDKPQNFHAVTTPRIGGLGILAGLISLAASPFGLQLIPSVVLSFLSGFFEDLNNHISPLTRMVLQAVAAVFAVVYSHAVVTYLGLGITMPYWLGLLFSLFAIVGMMNAINIIDGFNGLASGVSLMILLSFLYVAHHEYNDELIQILLVVLGALSAFFLLNFPKGFIFLGDGGAYMLGFIIALIGIFLASKYEDVSPWYVLAVFIYPVWEVLFSIGRRVLHGRSALQADATHLHTLLYKHVTKNNPYTSLLILVFLTPFLAISTIFANHSFANLITICVFIVSYQLLYHYLWQKEKDF